MARKDRTMSKERKVMLILDTIYTILMAVCVIINAFEGDFRMALIWNMNFTLWICNTALDLMRGEKEKIIAKLKEEDNKK